MLLVQQRKLRSILFQDVRSSKRMLETLAQPIAVSAWTQCLWETPSQVCLAHTGSIMNASAPGWVSTTHVQFAARASCRGTRLLKETAPARATKRLYTIVRQRQRQLQEPRPLLPATTVPPVCSAVCVTLLVAGTVAVQQNATAPRSTFALSLGESGV